ncbi:Oidioi.mRNA.OKI2018_I69.PAR.g10491.t1.cds [Oikopleura dioica]|uniref:Oidioi.mRNA.OKI2018_I69.PAR.g10491.t1.cds n=1 Tax=Oikopleura dioica TaxID=34765 RepID=A0ABN7RYG9_OIKDI|nr:Oidioi.mRNA.OKI2018_I69.PAR.g10491.t1.cds [Oikopleura dioica]
MRLDERISKAECGEQNGNFSENASCYVACLETLEFECSCTYVEQGMRMLNKEGCYWQQKDETQRCELTQTSNFLQTTLDIHFQELLTESQCQDMIQNALVANYLQVSSVECSISSQNRKRRSSTASSTNFSVVVSSTVESINGTVPSESVSPDEFIENLFIAFESTSGADCENINTESVLTIDYPVELESVFQNATETSTSTESTTTGSSSNNDEFIKELEAQLLELNSKNEELKETVNSMEVQMEMLMEEDRHLEKSLKTQTFMQISLSNRLNHALHFVEHERKTSEWQLKKMINELSTKIADLLYH